MLRRVARVLRGALLVLGLLLLAWLPPSLRWFAYVSFPIGAAQAHFVACVDGYIVINSVYDMEGWPNPLDGGFGRADGSVVWRVWPGVDVWSDTRSTLYLPLWLPAFLCLAWPVTSFIIHRHRRKRGFPVEPKGAGDSVNISAS